jgi:hypothetical protein
MLPANKTANPGLKILVLKTRSLGLLGLIVRIGLLVMMTSTGLANFSDAAHVKAKPAASALSANQAYHSMVLLDGPVGYWRLGDQPGSTTIQDRSPSVSRAPSLRIRRRLLLFRGARRRLAISPRPRRDRSG